MITCASRVSKENWVEIFHFFNCNIIIGNKRRIENLERIGLILHQRYIGLLVFIYWIYLLIEGYRVYVIILFAFYEMIRYLWDLLDQRISSDSREEDETHPVFITLLFPFLASRNSERKKTM